MRSILFWCALLLVMFCIIAGYNDIKTRAAHVVMAEGVYDHAEYIGGGGFSGCESTTIYFEDGRTNVIVGARKSMPFPKGTNIRVIRYETFNGVHYEIEKAPDPEKVR